MKTLARKTSTRPALEQLDELDAEVNAALELPEQLAIERRSASADVVEARARLQAQFATPTSERDGEYLEQLSHELAAAESAANRSWNDERAGSEEAHRRAAQRREEWIDENLGRLAAELIERATGLRDDTVSAVNTLVETVKRERELAADWVRVLGDDVRLVGGGETKPLRLHGIDWYCNPHTARAHAEIRAQLHKAIVALAAVDIANLRRQVPAQLDTEGSGTPLPVIS